MGCTCDGDSPIHFGYHVHLYKDYGALKHQVWPLIVDSGTVAAYFGSPQAKIVGIARMIIHSLAYTYHYLQDKNIRDSPYFEGKKIPLTAIKRKLDKKHFFRGAVELYAAYSLPCRISLFAADLFISIYTRYRRQ